jgi:hypothetical protein
MKNEPIITRDSLLEWQQKIQNDANAAQTVLVRCEGAMTIVTQLLADLEPQKEPNEKQVPSTGV